MPDGATAPALAAAAFAISAGLTEVIRRLCLRRGILDHPTADRWHRAPRPRLGGVAIFAAVVVCVALTAAHPLSRPVVGLVAGAAFTFAWGLIDDLRRLRAGVKLLLLLVTGVVPVAFGVRFDAPPPWGIVLTALWVIGVTNAVNWLDNMDGVAAGVTAVAAATLYGLSVVSGNALSAGIALAVGGAALGFLVLNFPPAKIFMGDCGSGVLGYALAVTAVLAAGTSASPFPVPVLVSALVLGVPLFDMMLVAALRTLRGHPVLAGGRDHLAHRLVACGVSERDVALLFYTITLATGAGAVFTMQASGAAQATALGLGAVPLAAVGAVGFLASPDGGASPLWRCLVGMWRRYGAAALHGALIAAGLALLYYRVVAALAYQWQVNAEYSYGPLILLVSAYLVWRRRAGLSGCPPAPCAAGYVVILAGLAMLIVGEAAVLGYLMRVSLLVVIAGLILFLSGSRTLRVVAFPLAYLLFMIPLPYVIFNRITLPLQFLASNLGTSALDAVGVPVLREGNVITLATAQLGVTEACSGIRSLIALGAIGVIYAYWLFPAWWRRVVIVASTVPIAIVMNAARVTVTGVLAERLGLPAAMGFYHMFSGLAIFAAAVLLLALEGAALAAIVPPADWRRVHASSA